MTLNKIRLDNSNFCMDEFECPCCHTLKLDDAVLTVVQKIRTHIQQPLTITSGYRCEKHNEDLADKGYQVSKTSQHMTGEAVDILAPRDYDMDVFATVAEAAGARRVGVDKVNRFLHISVKDVFDAAGNALPRRYYYR
jgi:uncharacterized protein YcbK (DUF882 family)